MIPEQALYPFILSGWRVVLYYRLTTVQIREYCICKVYIFVLFSEAASIAESEREGTRAETRTGLSAKRTSPFKSAGGSVQSTTG